jgi:hypothetical protein
VVHVQGQHHGRPRLDFRHHATHLQK